MVDKINKQLFTPCKSDAIGPQKQTNSDNKYVADDTQEVPVREVSDFAGSALQGYVQGPQTSSPIDHELAVLLESCQKASQNPLLGQAALAAMLADPERYMKFL